MSQQEQQQEGVPRREVLKRLGWAVPVVLTVGLSHKAFAQYQVDCRTDPTKPECDPPS